MRLLRFRLSLLQAMIIVAILGILTPFLLSAFFVCWALVFGHVPWERWSVLQSAREAMVRQDPKFRKEDHDATIQWVGRRDGWWVVQFTHKITKQRRCLRWINCGVLYGYTLEEIDCSTGASARVVSSK
jgi:hypothetical protein